MLLSLFLIPFAAFAVQLPYAFEAEMNYFQKYKSAQEISNDTDLAATKDGIKVLMVHPDTRKVCRKSVLGAETHYKLFRFKEV